MTFTTIDDLAKVIIVGMWIQSTLLIVFMPSNRSTRPIDNLLYELKQLRAVMERMEKRK